MSRLVIATVLVAALGAGSPARADDAKSVQTAQILGGVGAGASSALVLAGFLVTDVHRGQAFNKPLLYSGLGLGVVAPSLGQWYVGDWITIGMAVRVAAAGLATYALTNETYMIGCDTATMSVGPQCTNIKGTGMAMLGIAAIAFIGGMAYDVSEAQSSVEHYNARHGFAITPAPTVIGTPTGGSALGLSLAGYF